MAVFSSFSGCGARFTGCIRGSLFLEADLLLRSCTTLYVWMLDLVTSSLWNSGGGDVRLVARNVV